MPWRCLVLAAVIARITAEIAELRINRLNRKFS